MSPPPPLPDDATLVAALRAGDDAAFVRVVRAYDATLRRLARGYVGEALVDEVVQDTWIGVLRGLATFEARAAFRTWVCRILINRARTLAVRSARMVPMSSLGPEGAGDGGDAAGEGDSDAPAAGPPAPWSEEDPARLAAQHELIAFVEQAVAALPERQRVVVTLRDLHDWSAEDVCNALDLTESNQRVLLHRGRLRVRAMLEQRLTASRVP